MAARHGGAFALVALCLLELALRGAGAGDGEPLVPAMFVFGDSTVDVGNNNFLPGCSADCRANYARYGVDYPSHAPTGRFSNGYNLADHIARFLGFAESPPAYGSLPPEGIIEQMRSGINFASGGSGLQDVTGKALVRTTKRFALANSSRYTPVKISLSRLSPCVQCGQVHSMSDQLDMFASVVQMMGNCSSDLVSRSLVFISVGSNDLFEYVGGNATSCPNRNDTAFLQGLVAAYRSYLQELYAAGARKFSIVSPSLVGCCPSQRFAGWLKDDLDGYYCFGTANSLSRQLYRMLLSILQDLSAGLADMNFSICDSAAMADSVFNSTVSAPDTMNVVDTGCCGGAGILGPAKCDRSATLCPDRAAYLFWDGFHPTETASAVAALALFADSGRYVHPINITRLAAL
ncbi:GDSL esterase/lipase At5g45670-like [Lolium rigidum]|uniref:GDSL esterase/lipase At5g45670-like n=1 Tax=Lolium rigidum TaxID=89674 RepID=UPI001F5DD7FE|nr:GDSL esterase/lipase At5g45670-like [Lolium rigidum]